MSHNSAGSLAGGDIVVVVVGIIGSYGSRELDMGPLLSAAARRHLRLCFHLGIATTNLRLGGCWSCRGTTRPGKESGASIVVGSFRSGSFCSCSPLVVYRVIVLVIRVGASGLLRGRYRRNARRFRKESSCT